jgi:hypothetical protein
MPKWRLRFAKYELRLMGYKHVRSRMLANSVDVKRFLRFRLFRNDVHYDTLHV